MLDSCGRVIDYARISITDRCNLRCRYCMPAAGADKTSRRDILSYEEITRVCRVLAELGIRRLKITGGEPLVRKGVAALIASLKRIPGIEQISLTTNGVLLSGTAEDLAAAGLDAVNISLDTLDPARYQFLTRLGDLADVLRGIDAAVAAKLGVIKINCVPLSGGREADIIALAELARDRDIHVRFIEMMPIGLGRGYPGVKGDSVQRLLEAAFGEMTAFGKRLGNGPASYYSLKDFRGKIGFINGVSGCFCSQCNRIRLTADGVLKTCLHADGGVSLANVLKPEDDSRLAGRILQAVSGKPTGHGFISDTAPRAETRIMSQIGG